MTRKVSLFSPLGVSEFEGVNFSDLGRLIGPVPKSSPCRRPIPPSKRKVYLTDPLDIVSRNRLGDQVVF